MGDTKELETKIEDLTDVMKSMKKILILIASAITDLNQEDLENE